MPRRAGAAPPSFRRINSAESRMDSVGREQSSMPPPNVTRIDAERQAALLYQANYAVQLGLIDGRARSSRLSLHSHMSDESEHWPWEGKSWQVGLTRVNPDQHNGCKGELVNSRIASAMRRTRRH